MVPTVITLTPVLVSPAVNACSIISHEILVSLPITTFGCSFFSVSNLPRALPTLKLKSAVSDSPAIPRIPSVPKYFLIKK